MTAFSGSALNLQWITAGGTTLLHTDCRSFDWTPTLSLIDSTAGADSFREYITGIGEGGDISASLVLQTGATALISALARGTAGTLIYSPEGTATGKPKSTIPAISKGPSYSQPYDDVVEFKVSWQQSAAETNAAW